MIRPKALDVTRGADEGVAAIFVYASSDQPWLSTFFSSR
ncbi:hypothetical protein LMG19083_00744 [Ralstonia psammae]|uniref:Uncharacterized protein n=1 Tax=Ralstonia psammae TaxID=3058598 RepID=A0ABN9IID7_9RALS|nr:hypothetical protein LMG19083_00744 [Ralstonia sp. LMG 19083]